MKIREEQPSDVESIWKINLDAFETDVEANLVNALRGSGCTYVSLVAELKNQVVGYILFTPVELVGNGGKLRIMGLAPMAVLSQYQHKGIGSKLVKVGLEYCKSMGYEAVVVLGHPGYYPKFGFAPCCEYGIKSEYDVPDDTFMIMELAAGSLKGHRGIIKYHEVFSSA